MKVFNHIGMALCLLVGLASCEMREEILGKKDSQESGLLRLNHGRLPWTMALI